MRALSTRTVLQRVLLVGALYFGLGVISAVVSNPLRDGLTQVSIRVGILIVAVALFVVHFRIELPGSRKVGVITAVRAAGAVACGTFFLAVFAVVTAAVDSASVQASLLLALIIWPLASGVPAFFAGLLLGKVFRHKGGIA